MSKYTDLKVSWCVYVSLTVCGNGWDVMSLEAVGASSYSLGGCVLSQQAAVLLLQEGEDRVSNFNSMRLSVIHSLLVWTEPQQKHR